MSDKIESFTCADQFNQIDSSSLPIKYEISPANDEPNCERKIKECEEKCLQKSRRSFLPIGCGLAFYFLLGATEKMPSSYFSPESRKRGLSTFEIGLSPAVDHAMNFLFSFLLMLAIRKRTEKIFCVLGMITISVSYIISSGLHWIQSRNVFLYVSVCLHTSIGIGNAMSMATTIPIITKVSLRHAGTITSLAEALINLGWLIGSPLGSVIYTLFGMYMPPLLVGSLLFVCGFSAAFLLPSYRPIRKLDEACRNDSKGAHVVQNEKILERFMSPESFMNKSYSSLPTFAERTSDFKGLESESKRSLDEDSKKVEERMFNFDSLAYVKFLSKPNLLIISMLSILVAVQSAFFDICLPLYLKSAFELDAVQIGLVFSAYLFTNVGMIPVYGISVDKGYAMHVTFITSFGFALTLLALYLPVKIPQLNNILYITACFTAVGVFSAGAIVSSYLLFEKIAQYNGFNNLDQTKILVATWVNNLFALGALFGSTVISGHIFENYGFNFSCLVISGAMFGFLAVSVYLAHRMKMLRKLFYVEEKQKRIGSRCKLADTTYQPIQATMHYN